MPTKEGEAVSDLPLRQTYFVFLCIEQNDVHDKKYECRETKEARQRVHLGVKTVIFFLCSVSLCSGLVIA